MTQKTKIKANEWYSLKQVWEANAFPWLTDMHSYSVLVERDRQDRNLLKAAVTGKGRGKRYHIKGENIIKFLAQFEEGNYPL